MSNAIRAALRQSREFRQKHPGYLLLFRIGDFYEMFEQDAQTAAKILGITLSSCSAEGIAGAIPMAGVPFHAIEVYLRRLIAGGVKCAICEVADPQETVPPAPAAPPAPTPAEPQKTLVNVRAVLPLLKHFVAPKQLRFIIELCGGEEGQFFIDKLCELAETISAMPHTYQQKNLGNEAIVSLHYFTGGCDWYITEKDKGSKDDAVKGEQHQAFGYANLGYGFEAGYISLPELFEAAPNVEIDLHFTPRKVCEVKKLNEVYA